MMKQHQTASAMSHHQMSSEDRAHTIFEAIKAKPDLLFGVLDLAADMPVAGPWTPEASPPGVGASRWYRRGTPGTDRSAQDTVPGEFLDTVAIVYKTGINFGWETHERQDVRGTLELALADAENALQEAGYLLTPWREKA